METIDLAIWEPNPDDPRYLRYAGQPVAEEVFAKLEQRLKDTGMLPDEYFLMDLEWGNGREIPKEADIFCATDYGESEGVYVDVYLKWYEDGRPITKSFATGKTLGESGYDLDRMFLTASAITKAFHGECSYDAQNKGVILDLNAEEKRMLAGILSQQEQTPELQRLADKLNRYVPQPEETQAGPVMEMTL